MYVAVETAVLKSVSLLTFFALTLPSPVRYGRGLYYCLVFHLIEKSFYLYGVRLFAATYLWEYYSGRRLGANFALCRQPLNLHARLPTLLKMALPCGLYSVSNSVLISGIHCRCCYDDPPPPPQCPVFPPLFLVQNANTIPPYGHAMRGKWIGLLHATIWRRFQGRQMLTLGGFHIWRPRLRGEGGPQKADKGNKISCYCFCSVSTPILPFNRKWKLQKERCRNRTETIYGRTLF